MAKKSNRKSPRPAPDSLLTRHLAGYGLLLTGVLVFLAVFLHMQGAVFDSLRRVAFGLSGSFAFLLPLLPVWAGLSLILPRRSRGGVRVPVLSAAVYLLLLACAMVFTYIPYGAMGRIPLMDYFAYRTASYGGFTDMLSQAFAFCSAGKNGLAGGLLGTLIAWPLWRVLGPDMTGFLLILGILACLIGLFRVDVVGIIQSLRMEYLKLRESRSASRSENEKAIREKEQALKTERQVRQAARSELPAMPQPPAPVPAQDPYHVTGFAETPEEQPDYGKRPRGRRHPGSRLFPDQDKPASAAQAPAPAPVPVQGTAASPDPAAFSPQLSWQLNQAASPFKAEEDLVNPYGHTGANRPAAAFPNPPEIPAVPPVPEAPKGQRRPSQWLEDAEKPADGKLEAPGAKQEAPAPAEKPAPAPAEDKPSPELPPAPAEKPASSPEASPVQKPMASWMDTPPAAPTSLPVGGDVILPPAISSPSTWSPELTLRDPGHEKTYGDTAAEEEEEEDTDSLPIPYIFPDPSLLKDPDLKAGISAEEDAMRSKRLEETLASFKIACQVKHVTHGPAISRFELELAAGIKVSKITDLGPNIAMNMEVKSVRIEAPIPGKSLVGVEVPNRKVSTVTLKEVLSSERITQARDPLVVALGKDIAGAPVICNLAKMPHLLIAGATGSGKSVCINAIVCSLLYRTTPDQVRLILVDPKVVELQCYNGIPHLLAPVVSDPHKAAGALQWAVDEMMRRYAVFQEAGVRNLDGYNALIEGHEKPMPRIVIIIDELADLMMTCKREVEEYICRIAQLARAAGIHLIVATQRPSVDVITGLIKANIPSRIAFKVSSFIDSRTILDKNGAEQLLGYGDMLYQPMGEFTPTRVQGCFLSDEEVNSITGFIRKTSASEYDEAFVQQLSRIETDSTAMPDMLDPAADTTGDGSLLEQCIEIALMDGQVSTSLLQRRLKIGYARAGRLVDEMEKRGIISQKDGAKPRMCLITREEYEQMKQSGLSA